MVSRSLVGVVAGVLLLAGCSVGKSQENPAPTQENSGLARVDPCTVFSADQLASFGLKVSGKQQSDLSFEPGCDYEGDKFGVSIYKNSEKTVQTYGQQQNWATFEPIQVNGRSGARAVDKSATQAGACTTMFVAGGGVIIVDLAKIDNSVDECGEALKLAQAIEPNVPK